MLSEYFMYFLFSLSGFWINNLYGLFGIHELAPYIGMPFTVFTVAFILYGILDKNMFIQGFLKNIYLHPSCYDCPAKAGKSKSDIMIADFWNINIYHPKLDDGKGCNLLLLNTLKGKCHMLIFS